MFDLNAVKESFGSAAPSYDAHALLQAKVRRHCVSLAKWPAGAHVLDAGCGTGKLQNESRWRVTGLDLAAGMCRASGAVNADAAMMPFADRSFDGVFSSLMLQWVDDPARVFGEMARVAKPGATLVLSTLTDGTLRELHQSFAAADAAPHVSRFRQPGDLIAAAEGAGLMLGVAHQERMVEYYPDAIALMRALQAIGATNADSARRRGLMTPRQFARIEKAYESQFGTERGLPATWQLLFLTLRKR